MSKPTILVIHGYCSYPLRSTVRDLLFSFKKHADANVFYLNLNQLFTIPEYIRNIEFDLIIFHTVFLSGRWMHSPDFFKKNIIEKCICFKNSKAIKIAMPQDEWIHTDMLRDFINELDVNMVFSVAPPSEWKVIYDGVDFDKVKFYEVLTGYLDDDVINKVNNLKKENRKRDIDIGYRAFKSPPWLGRRGYLKTSIAGIFKERAPGKGFKIDISTEEKDTITGDKWYEFLLRCKYFIGVEGGSTVIDRKGDIWKKGQDFQKSNPNAGFAEFEANCFPGMDGNLKLLALSPRHLEACLTETCQVLVEGSYNNILKPDIHYIPLKKDFSDIDSVLERMKNNELRLNIISNTKRDIVDSGKYTYKAMVDFIVEQSLKAYKVREHSSSLKALLLLNKLDEARRMKRLQLASFFNRNSVSSLLYNCNNYLKYNLKVRVKGRWEKIFTR